MIHSFVSTFVKEEDGQDLVEYSLLLAFIALAVIATMGTVKTSLQTIWTNVNTKLDSASKTALK